MTLRHSLDLNGRDADKLSSFINSTTQHQREQVNQINYSRMESIFGVNMCASGDDCISYL